MSLLQDQGRFGYQGMGFTTGGAMDEHASLWANRLLSNSINSVVVEITLGNVELIADADCVIAICGADMSASINGALLLNWSTHYLHKGDFLSFGWAREGVRSYLAIKGGFQVPFEFGSASTVVRESVGGLNGKALQKGDSLPFYGEIQEASPSLNSVTSCTNKMVPWPFVPDYSIEPVIRVIPGYQVEEFSTEDLNIFYSQKYNIQANSDRMGFRLSGPKLKPNIKGMLSEGIAYGAIQVPEDGQPIILLKDRQTLGGYPKLGSVLPVDAFRLSQSRPGSDVSFRSISLEEGQLVMRAFYDFFR